MSAPGIERSDKMDGLVREWINSWTSGRNYEKQFC